MATNPIELVYQTGRTVYCFRSQISALTPYFYNNNTGLYEAYSVGNWLKYKISVPEVAPGYYRAIPPSGSLTVQATEIFYEVQNVGVGPVFTDAPPIATGNSQGVNIASVGGAPFDGFDPSAAADICNLALTHLGQSKIASLNDNSENARKCNLIFGNCAKEVLREAWWNFSTVVALLVLNSDQTTNAVPGWNYVYDLPTNCLLVRKVYGETGPIFDITLPYPPDDFVIPITNPSTIPFRVVYVPAVAGKELVCNITPAYIEYTALILDVTQWDADFIKAMTFKLASELANVLTGSQSKADKMAQMYQLTLSAAQKINGNEDGVPRRQNNNYLDSRA